MMNFTLVTASSTDRPSVAMLGKHFLGSTCTYSLAVVETLGLRRFGTVVWVFMLKATEKGLCNLLFEIHSRILLNYLVLEWSLVLTLCVLGASETAYQ